MQWTTFSLPLTAAGAAPAMLVSVAACPDWIFASPATTDAAQSRTAILGVRRGRLPKASRNLTR
jgi:hypothetical protein